MTSTMPGAHTRCRPLRTRSVIITFSARSLAARPAAVVAVPLIGADVSTPSSSWRKSSGAAATTQTGGNPEAAGTRTPPWYGAGLPAAGARASGCASGAAPSARPAKGAVSTRQMFAWQACLARIGGGAIAQRDHGEAPGADGTVEVPGHRPQSAGGLALGGGCRRRKLSARGDGTERLRARARLPRAQAPRPVGVSSIVG